MKEGRRGGGGRARLPSSVYLDALGSGGSGSPSAAAAPSSGGGARAAPGGCGRGGRGARRMCCLTLRGPQGSRSSGSQHFLSLPEPDTDSSPEHPVCGARPAPGPRPPRPAPLPQERPPLPLSLTGSLQEVVAPARGWKRAGDLRRSIGPSLCNRLDSHLSCSKQKSFSVLGALADMPTLNNFHSQTTTLRLSR